MESWSSSVIISFLHVLQLKIIPTLNLNCCIHYKLQELSKELSSWISGLLSENLVQLVHTHTLTHLPHMRCVAFLSACTFVVLNNLLLCIKTKVELLS